MNRLTSGSGRTGAPVRFADDLLSRGCIAIAPGKLASIGDEALRDGTGAVPERFLFGCGSGISIGSALSGNGGAGLLRSCAAEKEGRSLLSIGGVAWTIGMLAEDVLDVRTVVPVAVDLESDVCVVALPDLLRFLYSAIASASRSLTRDAIGVRASDAIVGGSPRRFP